jgi:hypothetical protein
MASDAEIEAAAKALCKFDGGVWGEWAEDGEQQKMVYLDAAEAVLTAAEKVRKSSTSRADSKEAHRNAQQEPAETHGGQVEEPQHKGTDNRAEVEELRVIPDEAVEAGAWALTDQPKLDPLDIEDAKACLTAALPHLEAAPGRPINCDNCPDRADLVSENRKLRDGFEQYVPPDDVEAAIRADERAKVRERVRQSFPPSAELPHIFGAGSEEAAQYDSLLTAIGEADNAE